MKKLYLLLLFILFIPITTSALECEIKPIYHITFNTDSSNNISKISVTDDIKLPIPVKDNYKFMGWYYDEDLTIKAEINTSNDIDKNYYVKISKTECEEYYELKLYAKWEKICPSDIITHHIIYVTNTDEKISKLSVPINKEEKVTLKIPTRKGYKFIGWYYDSEYNNKVDITTYNDIDEKYYTKVSSTECNDFYEMKIYAKWSKIITSNSNSNSNSNKSNNNSNSSENKSNIVTSNESSNTSNESNIELSNSNIKQEEIKVDKKNNNIYIYITIGVLVGSILGFIIYRKRKS